MTDSHKNDKKHKKHKKVKKDKKEKTVVIKVGTKVKKRPANAVVIKYDKHDYWYDNGVYYIECSPSVYEVIRPRVGMVVPVLPRYAEKVIIKGEPFFKFETTLYKDYLQTYIRFLSHLPFLYRQTLHIVYMHPVENVLQICQKTISLHM